MAIPSASTRCSWCGSDPIYVAYHDDEWGVPEHDDDRLFEKLILDGFQAGLSWITILRRRPGLRAAFDHFHAPTLARYSDARLTALMQDTRVIRNRAKIAASVTNARAYLALREEGHTLDAFLWQFTAGKTLQYRRKTWHAIPAQTRVSEAMSKALKQRGFAFVGPTICYAFMQAVGMVNDHVVTCFRHTQLGGDANRDAAAARR